MVSGLSPTSSIKNQENIEKLRETEAAANELPVWVKRLPVLFFPIRFLVKLQEFNYQLKVKAVFDK